MTTVAPTRVGTSTTGTPSGVVVTALLGLGAAVMLLAAVPGVLRDGEGGAASRVLAGIVLAVGLAALAWSLLGLRRGIVPAPRTAVATAFGVTGVGVLSQTAAQGALLAVLPGARVPAADDYATAALLILTAFAVVLVRRAAMSGSSAAGATPGAGRRLLALAAGATVVGALVTPGLAASAAGASAVPHGTHGTPAASSEEHTPPPQADFLDPARSDRPAPPSGHH
ncbi:hypothetical protein C8046_07300 [Serinibacter arcticus]|uniref:Uncharacterized protein n=1 Tax=Serinibacter arcticus TaxID=1655435 RepID=A0A2U1ZU22_9MICO|nr:hypothetical protein [Serinibacter arcticus]PWD50487.1 hypothetical protein C8046_07300 [Serinibacter arcticus]